MSAFQMNLPRGNGSKPPKDKGFSSKGKIEKYNQDGTETILVMGRPFRVVQKISSSRDGSRGLNLKERNWKHGKENRSYVFLVENTENLPEFPNYFALKRSFFGVNEVLLAHREPEIVGRVKDKNIVHVFHTEVTRSEGKLGVTVAMMYCSSNLYHRLRPDPRVPEGEIVQVLLAVTSAVGYLHSCQPPIAHRNICPDNILIHSGSTGAASYRLCNFSSAATEAYLCANREEVAMAVEDIERNTSPGFRAPEMADPGSGKRIDERVDLWSIGVLLYYMMYLRLPFGETSMGLSGRLKLRFPAGTETWYSSSLRVILTHLLEPDPEKRWDIFALTNFLRFDDDVSKHIGTFFFTETEWPDGWEQQDVKVVNRPVPPKAPPLRLAAGDGQTAKSKKDTNTAAADTSNSTRVHADAEGSSPPSFSPDAAALAAVGLDADSDDPEMQEYVKTIIREQEEAWRAAKGMQATQASHGDQRRVENEREKQQEERKEEQSVQNKKEEEQREQEKKEEAKKDIFEELFAPSPAAQPSPQPDPFAPSAVSPNAPTHGKDWHDSLFSSAQQQQQPSLQAETFGMAMGGNWGSGAPEMIPGGYPLGGVQGMPQMVANPQSLQYQQYQQPPQLPQQYNYVPHGGGGAFYAADVMQGPQPQQQQQPAQQQATIDFTKGNFPPPQPQPVQSKPEKKKDPFEELFF